MRTYSNRYHALKTKERALRGELGKVSREQLSKVLRAFVGMVFFSVSTGLLAMYVRKGLRGNPFVRNIGEQVLKEKGEKSKPKEHRLMRRILMFLWRSLLWPFIWMFIRKQRQRFL